MVVELAGLVELTAGLGCGVINNRWVRVVSCEVDFVVLVVDLAVVRTSLMRLCLWVRLSKCRLWWQVQMLFVVFIVTYITCFTIYSLIAWSSAPGLVRLVFWSALNM